MGQRERVHLNLYETTKCWNFFFLHLKNLYRMVRSNKFVQDGEIGQIQMRWQKFTNSYEHGKIVKI